MLDKSKVREWLAHSDGYGILDPAFFKAMGLDLRGTRHSSDPALGKHAATRADGQPGDVEGVSEFVAIRIVAKELGLNDLPAPFMGRGKNFRLQASAVLKALDEPTCKACSQPDRHVRHSCGLKSLQDVLPKL